MKLLRVISALCAAFIIVSSMPLTLTSFAASAASVASDSAEFKLSSQKLITDGFGYESDVVSVADISELPYVRVTYKTNVTAAHELILNVGGKELIICGDISKSCGSIVRSEAVFVPTDIRNAVSSGNAATVRCTAAAEDCEIEVTELRCFATDKAAYEYYGEKRTTPYEPNKITFGYGGNAAFYSSDLKYGNHVYEKSTDSLKINLDSEGNYRAMVRLADKTRWRENDLYVRIVYSADTKTAAVPLTLRNNATGESVSFGEIKKTDGFVLSKTVKLPDSIAKRYSNGTHNTFIFADKAADSTFRIKEILFFQLEETAASYKIDENKTVGITVMGEDISKYRVVIPKSAIPAESAAAQELSKLITAKSGVTVRTVTDNYMSTSYEIIIGNCNRSACDSLSVDHDYAYKVDIVDKKIVINGITGPDITEAVDAFNRIYLESGKHSDGDISLDSDIYLASKNKVEFAELEFEAADEPISVNYGFDSEADIENFSVSGGKAEYRYGSMRITGDGLVIAESSLYDSDMSLEWAFSYSDAKNDAAFGAMLRQSGGDSYVSVCYDVNSQKLSVRVKPSMAYPEYVIAECELELLIGHLYRMGVKLAGDEISVSLWGNEILSTDGVFFSVLGKTAFFTDGAALEVCEIDAELLTVSGRITGEAVFNETVIMEAGGDSNYRIPSMICTNSGTLIAAANDRRYSVADGAEEQWLVYRRKEVDGDWEEIKVLAAKDKTRYAIGNAIYDDVNDVIIILYSSFGAFSYDDGVTWEIKEVKKLPNSYGKVGGTHGGSAGFVLKYGEHAGRIISPARFSTVSGEQSDNLRLNHYNCTIYSDDGGLTWQTSEPVQAGTGEGTLIEREDGVIMYNSRAYFDDHYRRVAYSYDGGETFVEFRLDAELLEPHFGVNASMLRVEMKNGQVITLFSNPYHHSALNNVGGRINMTVSLSYDEGRSWITKKIVHSEYSAYSCLTYNPVTDTFFLMYENGDTVKDSYGQISVVEFNLDWLLEG